MGIQSDRSLDQGTHRTGHHLEAWKIARGVTIPKPGKADYNVAMAYRVISILNCLRKIVEKMAADLISVHFEEPDKFHPGQYGRRPPRWVVDAVGVAIAQTQGAWRRRKVVGALLMDVAAAFPSVLRGCMVRKIWNMGIN